MTYTICDMSISYRFHLKSYSISAWITDIGFSVTTNFTLNFFKLSD